MASYRNLTRDRIALATGYLDPGATRNANPADPAIVTALADGDIVLVDGNAEPPAPATRKVPVMQDVSYASGVSQVDADDLGLAANGVELGMAEMTSTWAPGSIGANVATDIPGLSKTVTVGTRPITVRAFIPNIVHSVNAVIPSLRIVEGSDIVGIGFTYLPALGKPGQLLAEAQLSPAAGSHTYKAVLNVDVTGSPTITAASPSLKPFIQIVER
jgi:hypothetical protein